MRPQSRKEVVVFPSEFPKVTTGIFLPKQKTLITGHDNGIVVRWSTQDPGKFEILSQCFSPITTISVSPKDEVVVGCHSGLLFTFDLNSPKDHQTLQEAGSSVFSRVWRSIWPFDNVLISSSTYGDMRAWKRSSGGEWTFEKLPGHHNSIFGLTNSSKNVFVSGDYRGNILIWEYDGEVVNEIDRISTPSSIQNAAWGRNESFAIIGSSGRIRLFESDETKRKWNSVFEVDAATSGGHIIHVAHDGTSIFAGTDTELIQFDVRTQQVQRFSLESTRAIFSDEESVFALTDTALVSFQRCPVEVPIALVKYQYAKVSLIGHTGVGKTTFCSFIVHKTVLGIKSTLGKRIWTWVIEPPTVPERRIVFHDHGGQETVLGTFLPFLADSDIILVFFQQTDRVTFEKAAKILDEIPLVVDRRTRILLVRTHIDQPTNEVSEKSVAALLEKPGVSGIYPVCPPTGEGIEEVLSDMASSIDWRNAKTMIQSESVQGVEKVISELQSQARAVVDLGEARRIYEQLTGAAISKEHLSFLLSNFADQGIIEYYPAILPALIIDDGEYNRLRSEVPIFVSDNDGVVSVGELVAKFKPRVYVDILDRVYSNAKVAIQNRDLRIFPEKLRDDSLVVPPQYQSVLKDPAYTGKLVFNIQPIGLGSLIEALSEQNLGCIDVTKTEGLFGWKRNALVYYTIRISGDSLTGRFLEIVYRIGGEKQLICDRLNRVFTEIIDHLFGPPVKDVASHAK